MYLQKWRIKFMKYNVTSAEASKLLKKIMDEKNIALNNERQSSTFNASLAEDIESVRSDYNYEETKKYGYISKMVNIF